MNLRNYFERVYVVNLDKDQDRFTRFYNDLPADWPFKQPKRSQAVNGKRHRTILSTNPNGELAHDIGPQAPAWFRGGGGAWGCYRSHMRLIEDCLNNGVESVLLLEDDATFLPDFTARVTAFLSQVPDDWGMLYFGGQHLKTNLSAPLPLTPRLASTPSSLPENGVYVPYNVNRTHAFALRGKTMQAVYRHLSRQDWSGAPHHIDHQLGLFHQAQYTRFRAGQDCHKIYCPGTFLVGQASGHSNISGRTRSHDAYWRPAATISQVHDTDTLPFVAILGLHSSGSSCVAGICHFLGLYLGHSLGGYYGRQPDLGTCGYEAVGLAQICEKAIPFPSTRLVQKKGVVWTALRRWVATKRAEAQHQKTVAGGKYPQLCRLGPQLLNICQDHLYIVNVERPLEESIASLVRRSGTGQSEHSASALEAHQRWLHDGRQEILSQVPEDRVHTIHYPDLLKDPITHVKALAEFLGILGLSPPEHRIRRALAHVRPQDRHVDLSTVCTEV